MRRAAKRDPESAPKALLSRVDVVIVPTANLSAMQRTPLSGEM